MRPDGSVLCTAGYDKPTGILYRPDGDPPKIPESPSRDDAIKAADEVLALVADFPFAKPEHRSAWLASLLTPIARPAFKGPSPMFLTDANVRGSGKYLLVAITGLIITGTSMSVTTAPQNDEEFRKRITAIAEAGDRLVVVDNIGGTLGCASLDAALTSDQWRDRKLSTNEMIKQPLLATWYATGNNVLLKAVTSRRVCHMRIESPLEAATIRSATGMPQKAVPVLMKVGLGKLRCAAGTEETAEA